MNLNFYHGEMKPFSIFGTIPKKVYEGKKRQIVKIQIPLSTNTKEPLALIYPEKKEWEMYVPISKDLQEVMDGSFKKYFWIGFDIPSKEEHVIRIDEEVEDLYW